MNRDEALFYEALEQSTRTAAAAYLERACAGDELLRERVERLLAAHGSRDSLLDEPANVAVATREFSPAISARSGQQIGPYKLIQEIGEGGMGVVYMAQQTEPVKRLVALKIIKPGMDSRQVIARFEAERQALALMDHPNIAKVLDAGTVGQASSLPDNVGPAGRPPHGGNPYFVMELVKGVPITQYCDEKRLSPRERLELFIPVCHAVQHAHQKGIIHRDLKPSNVLVALYDGNPVPKVIDFGVAKATGGQLTEKTLVTNFGSLVGTVEYMSPEQAELNQLDVDTRSDIYALGVLLYELLTGETPLDRQRLKSVAFGEMLRLIREEEAETVSARIAKTKSSRQTPSAVVRNNGRRSLPTTNELDWIVARALEKDRARRYESASAFAADIQRYLSDEPVLACPPTAMYRFQKFARKHKPALVTAAAIALCLLLGTTVSAWQAVRATTAEAQAIAHEAQAQDSAKKADEKAKEATEQRDEAQKQRDEVKALADRLAAKEEELQRTQYADHIYMAKEAWDSGNVTRATSLLEKHVPQAGEPDRRGFEWHYLNRLSNMGPLISIAGPPLLRPQSFVVDPLRMRLVAYFSTGTVNRNRERTSGPTLRVWNLQTGQEELVAPLSGGPTGIGPINNPVFSPDTTRMTFHSRLEYDKNDYVPTEIKVWNTLTGQEILSCSGVAEQVAFSSDSKLLATPLADQTIKIWDVETGAQKSLLTGQLEAPHALVFSSDGKRVAAAGNKWDAKKKAGIAGEIKIWDAQTGEIIQTLKGHPQWMHQLAFAPDGQCLASSAEEVHSITLWDAKTGEILRTLPFDKAMIDKLQFNADGARLIASGYQKAQDDYVSYDKMWNTQTGQELLSIKEGSLEFTPDGKRVALSDWTNSRTKLFDANTGHLMLSVAGAGNKLAISPDSKRLATQAGGMRIWDIETGDEINHLKGFLGTSMLAFSQDGKRLVGSNNMTTQVWSVEAKQESSTELNFAGIRWVGANASSAILSSDFRRLAGISGRKIKIFDFASGQELRTLSGHDSDVRCAAISSDGKRVASSDGQSPHQFPVPATAKPGVVKVWDAETGKELFQFPGQESAIGYLTFSPDGKKLAGSAFDGTAKLWDMESNRELHTLGVKFAGFRPIFRLVFSPDSKRLVAATRVWDVETGRELVTPQRRALGAAQDSTAFSPDGKHVVGGRGRGTVFDSQTGEPLFTLGDQDSNSGPSWLTFSPDGKRLASSAGIWDAKTGQELLSFGRERRASGQVTFSPDGHRLAVIHNEGEVTIYDATPLPSP